MDQTDRELFFASTEITVGNGPDTPFWEARWLLGASPKQLAPKLYQQTRFKRRTVAKELRNMNWIKSLSTLNTESLMDECILLFSAIQNIQLSNERDRISWRWTNHGEYTAASAYNIQFAGSICPFPTAPFWQATTEPKCRFFAWLAARGKLQTADNLMKKNWPCDPNCALCYYILETTDHLLTRCNFAEAVWNRVASIIHL